jgi:hypothetical protein
VFIDSGFLSVDYSSEGIDGAERFHWTIDDGFFDTKGDAVDRVGKKEIPKGLHLILDGRGAAQHGEC